MIRKLRTKFIVLSMLSMLLVLAVIIGGMNIINYRKVLNDSDAQLQRLAENGGIFELRNQGEPPQGELPPAEGDPLPPEGMPGGIGRVPTLPDNMSAEDIFAARYFSVFINGNGEATETDTESIFMIDTDTAIRYAFEVREGKKTSGFLDNYRYLVSEENGGSRYIFLDCSRSLENYRSFRTASLTVSGIGMAVVFALILLLSGIIVRPASESYEKQKRFITDAGHEIKTPLAIINADTDVLQSELGDDNEWTEDIKLQVRRLTELTNDLVYLSRMDESANVTVKEKVDLSKLVTETADPFKAVALSGKKTYETDISPDITLTGDRSSLERLVSILLDNAMKYSPEGGKVKLKLTRSGKTITLKVTNDTDGNITNEDTRHMFDRFFRADSSRNSATGGHGLGLSIAKAITENHKGKISASVKENSRITVSVVFTAE
ncbi:MAG: HAMP domain-containing histidine kinase [Clostridiales bacterium]|nr:HAMP domain-containing histidine kinase [Clostridiales bacterium]